jgi:adenylate cyclase
MAIEIERKFLVKNDNWMLRASRGTAYRQGYVFSEGRSAVRVRVAGDRGFLAIKSPHEGISRREYEYEIPRRDAEEMLSILCKHPPVEKTRHTVVEAGLTWEVDVFAGANHGLVLAEIELEEEGQPVAIPEWAGKEVTRDDRYLNINLYLHPFREWRPPDHRS